MGGRGKGIAILAALFGAFAFFGKRKPAQATWRIGPVMTDVQLSTNFRLSEFLHSKYAPKLREYQPSQVELAQARRHVAQLQPLRNLYGPITITSGARPDSVAALSPTTGKVVTITQAMIDGGDDAALNSDHRTMVLGVSDFAPTKARPSDWLEIYQRLRTDPNTRQVILYFKRAPTGELLPDHFHLATVQPDFPALPESTLAFINIDGKRATGALAGV